MGPLVPVVNNLGLCGRKVPGSSRLGVRFRTCAGLRLGLCGSLFMSNVQAGCGHVFRWGGPQGGGNCEQPPNRPGVGCVGCRDVCRSRLAPSTHEGIMLTIGTSGPTCPSGQQQGPALKSVTLVPYVQRHTWSNPYRVTKIRYF